MHPHTGITGSPAYAWKGNGGSTLKLIDPAADCLLDLTLAIGARVNGLCLDGQHLGNGVHGILVDKPDYGTTEDSPLKDNVMDSGPTDEKAYYELHVTPSNSVFQLRFDGEGEAKSLEDQMVAEPLFYSETSLPPGALACSRSVRRRGATRDALLGTVRRVGSGQ